MHRKPWSSRLRKKSERKGVGYPIATIAFYGPDNRHASKVAVGIVAFPWIAPGNPPQMTSLDHTVHGRLAIDGHELRAEVNSKERAERLRGMVAERLGSRRMRPPVEESAIRRLRERLGLSPLPRAR